MNSRKLMTFVRFAEDLASLSHCKRARVGCVIVPRDFSQVYSIGFNGPPSGAPNDSCTGEEGACGCVHAEANAVIKLESRDDDCLMISTTAPCTRCAGLIVNKRRVRGVVYVSEYRDESGLVILRNSGIETGRLLS